MKIRWLVLGVILFLLWGCDAPAEPETLPATEPEGTVAVTEPTVPSGLYLPESGPETATGGAVRVYPLWDSNARGIRFMGDDILLFSRDEATVLTLLSGEDRYISAQTEVQCVLSPDDPAVMVSEDGIIYYDSSAGELVFLDNRLEKTKSVPLPEHPTSVVLDRNRAYYCTESGLRALDLEHDLDRPLKEMTFPFQELAGIHCGGTVLQCRVQYEDGRPATLFLSADNGALLRETSESMLLHTDQDFYFAIRYDGSYRELLSSSSHFGPSVLVTDHREPEVHAVSGSHSVILTTPGGNDLSTVLDYYDLESGFHPYQITVPEYLELHSFQTDPTENVLWFLCYDPARQTNVLCRWDLIQSSTEDTESYLQPRRSSAEPDHEGLLNCRQIADTIAEKHGVNILIWEDAVTVPPDGYTLIAEYQVPLIESQLQQLDRILCRYPEGFLEEAAANTESGRLTICLVRTIEPHPGTPSTVHSGGLQYWDDRANAYLAVVPGDSLEQTMSHQLFHFIESYILCGSKAYDDWEKLNPADFEYDFDYAAVPSSSDWDLIQGEERAFTDFFAMSFPREDRARIMEYAMMPGNEDCFSSAVMQKKLRTLCLGIRESFSLDGSTPCLWEQHLTEPLL